MSVLSVFFDKVAGLKMPVTFVNTLQNTSGRLLPSLRFREAPSPENILLGLTV